MSLLFSSAPHKAHQIAEQEEQLSRIDEVAEHARYLHLLMSEIKDAIEYNDPNVKTEQATLDPVQEVIVRYEEKRCRYAIYTTDTTGTSIGVQLMSGFQFKITTTAPGWVPLDLPPGTRLYSGDASRHVVLVRMSNLKV